MKRILIVDDDKALCRSMQIQLNSKSYETKCVHLGGKGLEQIEAWRPDLVFLDLMLPDQTGLDVLRKIKDTIQDLSIVMITGTQDTKTVIEAMQLGAFDYIRKPLNIDDIFLVIEKVRSIRNSRQRDLADQQIGLPAETDSLASDVGQREIIGEDKQILEVLKQVGILARNDVTVLIEGESGTGKELIARALHNSSRPGTPFVAINCSSIVATIPESELFGYEKGAFTGALRQKIGKFEHAANGTIFLDEIGDLALDLQAKLLRVIQESEFERVGGLQSIPLEARLVTATNRSLSEMVEAGLFRKDLFYRLAVSRLHLPPLRSRPDDIPLIAKFLANQIARHIHKSNLVISESALSALQGYDWPGNVRELENVLTRAILLSRGGDLSESDVSFALGAGARGNSPGGADPQQAGASESSVTPQLAADDSILTLREAEKRYIHSILKSQDWNITRTAGLLEISPTTLRKKINDYGLK